ncbi:hypothetical protein [Sphingomonas solaris]|uniref:Uncharacterized protein n=1 Tax=Alterirhizorhabdus solaris TaxID=2529389 RepID=A0A558RCK3_9SPHN|nr:hypothetical protein [Sphingomonas solaris]TVV77207.1 hypothetical protein FOY91_01320 [Sphingomonas solaris]
MRIAIALAALALPLSVLAAKPERPPIPETPSPRLAQALKGRIAGKPVGCINLRPQLSSQIVDSTAIIYKESRRRWYVTYPNRGDCPGLAPGRSIITRTPGTRLCSGDLARVVDLPMRFEYGSCAFSDFTPYVK